MPAVTAACPADPDKAPNNVLQVTGNPQHMNSGGGWADLPGPITIAAWYKPTGWNPNFASIASKGI